MIIWLNGAFGAGKTQTAYELYRRIPDSFVFDPENAGYYIRKNIPKEISKDDFQNFVMWREFNYTMLKHIRDEYNGIIIVPMTIVSPQYFDDIIGKLRRDGVVVHHFALCASRESLLKRLRSRGERKNSWPIQQIDRCIQGLAHDVFKQHLMTDHLSIEQVAETIASQVNIPLQPNPKGKLGKKFQRLKTQIKHIRLFH